MMIFFALGAFLRIESLCLPSGCVRDAFGIRLLLVRSSFGLRYVFDRFSFGLRSSFDYPSFILRSFFDSRTKNN
ncbi:hypothetical protein [uncultured Prevotella sp.]|uniref:hypothetical protein n=1 Tax=uncultured Prevotella sp. TaxID=159272 RepID=UPI0025DC53D3|nr:hypothetical protein [uncultured Prevotella sp.]